MDAGEEGDGQFDSCDHCGSEFEPGSYYPVETREPVDGGLELYSFCDDDCRGAWAED